MSDSKFLKVVYKYPFKVSDCVALALPKGAKLLTIQEQAGVAERDARRQELEALRNLREAVG